MSDTPKVDLDKELKILMVSLSQEKLKRVVDLVNQIKKLVAGNHAAVPILAPNVKQNTKGRPSAKKGQLTSTKRIQSAFEIVEEKIKKENTSKKRVLKGSGRKKAKQIKKSEDLENLDSEEEESFHKDDDDKGEEKESNKLDKENKSNELQADSIKLNKANELSKSHLVALAKGGETVSVEVITS
jgi:hypothetical protein